MGSFNLYSKFIRALKYPICNCLDKNKYTLDKLIKNGKIMNDLESELTEAVKNNSLEKVQKLLIDGADVHIDNDILIRLACDSGYTLIAKTLLCAGADVHVLDDIPITLAIIKGHIETVRLLLEYNANVHNRMEAPLVYTCIHNHPKITKLLLEHGADVYNEEMIGLTCQKNRVEILRILLEFGAISRPESINPFLPRKELIRRSFVSGYMEIVQLLLEYGVKLSKESIEKIPKNDIINFKGIIRLYYRDLNTDLNPDEVRSVGITLKDDEARYIPFLFEKEGMYRYNQDLVNKISTYL